MFKKFDTRKLLIAFAVLLAVVVILQIVKKTTGERNFSNKIIDVDTAKLTAIVFKHRDRNEIRMTRQGNVWSFTEGGKTYRADKFAINAMLSAIPKIIPDHVSGTEKSDWGKLGVNDTSAGVCHVKLEQDGKQVADFLVGRYSFQYPQTFYSYVRLADGTDVYSVKDLMPMTFGMTVGELRNRLIASVPTNDIQKLSFRYPADSSFAIVKQGNAWFANGTRVDSVKMATYLAQISNLSSGDFAADQLKAGAQTMTLTIEAGHTKPIEIKAFAVPDTAIRYIITSSQYTESRFNGRTAFANMVFVGAKHFIAAPPVEKPKAKRK